METEREKEAAEYLKKHKIMDLMENLTSMLFFHRPENPRQFLIAQLEQLKLSRLSGVKGPSLFSSSNLDTVYGILDPANRKHISFSQYRHALQNLGVKNINECPDGVNEDKISHDTFKAEATEGLQRSSETFHGHKSSP